MTDTTTTDQATYDDPADEAIELDARAEDLEADVREAFAVFEPMLWRMAEAAQLRATAVALRALAEVEPELTAPTAELDDARRDLERLTSRANRVETEIRDAQRRVDEANEREREAVLGLDIDTAASARQVARELRGAVRSFVEERESLKVRIATAQRRLSVAESTFAEVDAKVTAARAAVDNAAPSPEAANAPWLVRGLVDPQAHPYGEAMVRVQRVQLAMLVPLATLAAGMAHLGAQTQEKLDAVEHDPLNLRHNNGIQGGGAQRSSVGGRPVGAFVPR